MLGSRRPRVRAVVDPPQHEAGPRIGADFSAPKVVFLVHYSADALISKSFETLVDEFVRHHYYVIIVSSATAEGPLLWPKGLPPDVTVYRRPNIGYDFGSWSAILELHPAAAAGPQVLLVNDSLLGPFRPLTDVLTGFETNPADVWGLVNTTQHTLHLQSHWVGYHGGILSDKPLRDFWADIRIEPTKWDLIRRYELGLSAHLLANGYRIGVQYPYELVVPPGYNPAISGWRRLFYFGFPFIKREIVQKCPGDSFDGALARDVVAEWFGVDVLEWV